ncbi:DUF3649 domain-containing protein [Sphingomonas parapaucimobilis]
MRRARRLRENRRTTSCDAPLRSCRNARRACAGVLLPSVECGLTLL